MKIFPNPSKAHAYISVPAEIDSSCKLSVTNTLGEQILTRDYENIGNRIIPLDLSNHPNGLYEVTLAGGGHTSRNVLLLLSGITG